MNNKKIAIIKLSIISVVISLLLVFSFITFNGFAGFFNAAQKGTELDEGVYANYDVLRKDGITDEEYAEAYNNTFLKLKSLIEQKNYSGSVVYKTSNNTIRIESPVINDVKSLLAEIGSGEFKIRTSNSNTSEVKFSGEDIEFAVATTSTSTGYWGTYVQFTEEAAEVLSELTEKASETNVYLYFYRGDAENYFFYLPVSSQITNNYLFISSSSGSMTQENATNLAISISCGSMPAVVEIQGEVNTIYPITGAMLGLTIALGVSLLVILIIFALMYRELGLVSLLSILFYVGAMLFLIQTLPGATITSATIGSVLLGLILVASCNFIILEKIKSEYLKGKKLNIAVKTGYKRSIGVIADLCGAISISSLAMYLISSDIIKGFGLILIVGSLIACFSSLFLTYHLTSSYVAFNNNDGKRVNFKREENVNEIE